MKWLCHFCVYFSVSRAITCQRKGFCWTEQFFKVLLINIHFQVEFECLKTLLLSISEYSSETVKWEVTLNKCKRSFGEGKQKYLFTAYKIPWFVWYLTYLYFSFFMVVIKSSSVVCTSIKHTLGLGSLPDVETNVVLIVGKKQANKHI